MFEFVSGAEPIVTCLLMPLSVASLMAIVTFVSCCIFSIPVVERIRAAGGEAPTVTNLFLTYGLISLFFAVLMGFSSLASLSALQGLLLGGLYGTTEAVVSNIPTFFEHVYDEHFLTMLAVIVFYAFQIPSGIKSGRRAMLAAIS